MKSPIQLPRKPTEDPLPQLPKLPNLKIKNWADFKMMHFGHGMHISGMPKLALPKFGAGGGGGLGMKSLRMPKI